MGIDRDRRNFLIAAAGTTLVSLAGAAYLVADARAFERVLRQRRPDGRPRLPPGQYPIERIRPMGGTPGDPSPGAFRLEVHGEVERPFTLDLAALLALPQVELTCDVHCVTRWTVLDSRWTGVRVADLAARAGLKPTARFVVFE